MFYISFHCSVLDSTTSLLKRDLQRLDHTPGRHVLVHPAVRILKVHFKSGEWGQTSCGSVVTSVKHGVCGITSMYPISSSSSSVGKSLYCVVKKFLRSGESGFAVVQWLSAPEYPFIPNRLVVRVTLGNMDLQRRYGNVLSLEDIEPTPVYVSPSEDGSHFFLMREKGYDRSHVPI